MKKLITVIAAVLLIAGVNNFIYGQLGTHNTIYGVHAGDSLKAGSNSNTFVGWSAGQLTDTTDYNSFFGAEAGLYNIGSNNVFMGYIAGKNNTSASNNTFIGRGSGFSNTTGASNVFAGMNSGYLNQEGTQNVFVGLNSGYSNTANDNTFVGYLAGKYNTSGTSNVFIGHRAGEGVSGTYVTGHYNVFIGELTGRLNSTGTSNTFTGYRSAYTHTTGNYNTFYGMQTGYYSNTGDYNTFIGSQAGFYYAGDNANNNTFVGYKSGYGVSAASTTGSSNTFMGYESGKGCTSGYNNVFMGSNAGYTNTDGYGNTSLGTSSGYLNASGLYNTYLGFNAGYSATTSYNTFLGNNAGRYNTTGLQNTIVGSNAGEASVTYPMTGSYNIFMGVSAGAGNRSGERNLFIGNSAGGVNSTGIENIFLGYQTGAANTTGQHNIAIGHQAGYSNQTHSDNTFLGWQAGYTTKANGNVCLGYKAGYVNETGEKNVFIGCEAGSQETTSNKLYIDNSSSTTPLIYGDFSSNEITINGSLKSTGSLKDSDGHAGSAGDVLKSTGTGTDWVSAGSVETDPVFIAHDAFDITGTNISNWNTAYGWGNHATAGYLNSSSTAGGELSGTLSNLTVTKLLGKTISGTPTTGQVLKYNGSAWALTAVGGWEGSGANTVIATGNVGIGATSPVEKLEVAGNVKVTGGVNVVKNIGNVISFESNTGGNQSKWNIHKPVNADKVSFTYEKNGVTNYDILTLTDSGNVCIGANDDNGYKFIVNNSGNTNPKVTDIGYPAGRPVTGVVTPCIPNKIAQEYIGCDNRLFMVPALSAGGFNPLTKTNDIGIFWTDTKASGNKNSSSGLVIAPWSTNNAGIRITAEGNVGIGEYNPQSKLAVNGKITCKELQGTINGWTVPDYVFEADYKLMSLADLEQYVDTAKHLPNIPSREKLEETGNLNVIEMELKLLEKVEELTLYIIELKKQNDAIKTQNEELKTRVEALEKTN